MRSELILQYSAVTYAALRGRPHRSGHMFQSQRQRSCVKSSEIRRKMVGWERGGGYIHPLLSTSLLILTFHLFFTLNSSYPLTE